MPVIRSSFSFALTLGAVALALACSDRVDSPLEPSFAKGGGTTSLTVTSALPSDAPRDTTLIVQVVGTGFDNGSQATFPLQGVLDPRVRVNSTTFVTSTQLTANVTIAPDAVTAKYDAVVVTSGGKKGIGSELFTVTLKAQALAGGMHARSVNAAGVAVGDGAGPGNCSSGTAVPMLWQADGSQVVLPLGSACSGVALAINNAGTVMGYLGGSSMRLLWTPSGSGFVISPLGAAADGTLPFTGSALNDSGQVAGWADGGRMYWWSQTTGWLKMVSPVGATACFVTNAINNLGAVAGRCTVGGVVKGYYWANRAAAPLLLPRASGTGDPFPYAINDSGVIVGGGPGGAVRWTPTSSGYTVAHLPDLGYGSFAYAITLDGAIAGDVQTNPAGNYPRAAIWRASGGFNILGLLASTHDWAEAVDISNTTGGLVMVGSDRGQAVLWSTMLTP